VCVAVPLDGRRGRVRTSLDAVGFGTGAPSSYESEAAMPSSAPGPSGDEGHEVSGSDHAASSDANADATDRPDTDDVPGPVPGSAGGDGGTTSGELTDTDRDTLADADETARLRKQPDTGYGQITYPVHPQ
jgi:hypothetical protein